MQKLGPGGVQNWAGDIIAVLGEAHRAVEDARARGDTALGPQILDDLRERYDTAVKSGRIHNRLRDWDTGNHPGYALALLAAGLQGTGLPVHPRLRRGLDQQRQRARRESRQAAPGRLRLLALPRHPRPLVPVRSYLDSAAAHGVTALDAIRNAIEGKPWLPPLPAII